MLRSLLSWIGSIEFLSPLGRQAPIKKLVSSGSNTSRKKPDGDDEKTLRVLKNENIEEKTVRSKI